MKVLDKKTSSDGIKLLVFIIVTTLATGLLVVLIGNLSFAASTDYRAEFSDVTGMNTGDDVRVAGVKVGTVKDIEVDKRTQAIVTFSVDNTTRLSDETKATIKYRNLVGQRYIALTDAGGGGAALKKDDTIPLSRTAPALDLTMLFNGFKPLFQALSPADVNQLSYEVVQVFQGEGGTVESLLGHTASVTNTLASRDQVINDLIVNLNGVLDHLADRDDQLSNLIITFKKFVSGLKNDRDVILGSLDGISDLSVQTADLARGIRSPLAADIAQLNRFASNVDDNKAELDRALQVLPIKINKIGRTAIYGSWFNFYLCDIGGRVTLPGGTSLPVNYSTPSGRCDLG